MGDIVLTTPVIRCLKKQLNAEVHLLTQKRFFCLLENNPHLLHLHAIEEGLDNLKKRVLTGLLIYTITYEVQL